MITYSLLQQYWWLLVSLLGALVVFLMFVQGANTQIFNLGRTEDERALIVNSTGRKWEFTFTTLVTFGGALVRLSAPTHSPTPRATPRRVEHEPASTMPVDAARRRRLTRG